MRIAIVGYGRMGHAVEAAAVARGHSVVATIDLPGNEAGRALTRERLAGADVAVEFTTPAAAPVNIEQLIAAGVPVVCGTTGWAAELPRIEALVRARGGALLYAGNFSIGVQLFLRAARDLAGRFAGHAGFDAFIVEEHHARKIDAPSGTAITLRQGVSAADPARAFPITSIRAGAIPGTHRLSYDGPYDTVTLTHEARSRDGFAAGAVAAAEWLPGRRGVFTFEEMLFGDRP
ncbi:MAG TPA: dihydrodipicolinate reductase C-terminal domain-containing protein [Gemmatimonadales bacterium]|nr:dihydrodipicolinate reductase C-terminal domain-containing protein [Gemmatimonadales bacterium]